MTRTPVAPRERAVVSSAPLSTMDRLALLVNRPWAGPIAVLVVAALLRLIGLGYPHELVFDETYYVKDAWTLSHLGYEGTWSPNDVPSAFATLPDGQRVNAAFEGGSVDFFSSAAQYVAHPPFGKWLIALGELVAGGAQNSFGWRLSVAVAGILAVALTMWIAHRLFRTPFVTVVAGGLLAIDNQAIVMSRVGLLDNLVMLLSLGGVACVLEDRLRTERRLGEWLMRQRRDIGDWGPTFLWRPWLLAAGLAFGMTTAVKWSGLYFIAAFLVYVIASDVLLRRRAGVRLWAAGGLLKQAPISVLHVLPVAVVAYLVTWAGWFFTSGGYDRQYVQDGGPRFTGLLAWVPVPLQNLWAWHSQIYVFHTTLDASHPYKAPAILWPLIARPTSMWWNGDAGSCGSGSCVGAITDLPNPLIWYAGIAASIYLLVRFVRRREWQAGLILMGYVAGYLPWLLYPNRTMFFFYSIAFEPYLVLALAATLGLMVVRPPTADSPDEIVAAEARYGLQVRRGLVLVVLVLAVALSLFFLPISTGLTVPQWFWQIHMWSPTWI